MRSEGPVWCAKCYLRIAPYELQTVNHRNKYHQNCYLKLIREVTDGDKASRDEVKASSKERIYAKLRS